MGNHKKIKVKSSLQAYVFRRIGNGFLNHLKTWNITSRLDLLDFNIATEINQEKLSFDKDKLGELVIKNQKKELIAERHGKLDYVRWKILMR